MSEKAENFPKETLNTFEYKYLPFLRGLQNNKKESISVKELSEQLHIDERLVRRDMASLTGSGQLRSNYDANELIKEMEYYLGYYNCSDSALAGAGRTGQALLRNKGFKKYGLSISWVFDPDLEKDRLFNGIIIKPMASFKDIAARVHLHLGIIAVPPEIAQTAADMMVASGIKAVWNVSGASIEVPKDVIHINETFGEHEDIENNEAVALSLNALKDQLKSKMGWNKY